MTAERKGKEKKYIYKYINICRRPVVKKGGWEVKRKSLWRRKSLNNPSVIQEALSDGVHTNHKPSSAATEVQYPQGPKAATRQFAPADVN